MGSTCMDFHVTSNRIKHKNLQFTFTAKVCSKNTYITNNYCINTNLYTFQKNPHSIPGKSDSFLMENARNGGHISWSFHHRFVQKYLRHALLHIFNVGSRHCKTYSAQSENKLNFRHRHNISVGYVGRLWKRSPPHSNHFRVKLRPNLSILIRMHMFLPHVSIHLQY
jgi:hypothetical protein